MVPKVPGAMGRKPKPKEVPIALAVVCFRLLIIKCNVMVEQNEFKYSRKYFVIFTKTRCRLNICI